MKKLRYCTKEQVKALFALGCPLTLVYRYDGERPVYYTEEPSEDMWADCDAYYYPYLQEVTKWFREEKNIHICPIYYSSKTYKTKWYSCEVNQHQINNDEEYSTYEEALSAGIDKAIEILQN